MIETVTFRLAPDTDEAVFLDADRRVQTEFFYRQPGLARRTTARDRHGEWIVIVLWRSEADAEAAARRSEHDPAASDFMNFVDQATVRTGRYTLLD